ncbi:MoaF N-terminal domain-containing protein [Myroides sp. M-43]|uniref:MoaF-related domain-containing protein n=1 Tax=Myroides oncorhynchi TaxID=2893756 RepID=UPI001E52516A|nr:MoaF N-terminal domain-containing protein [Myroides oncorhynchi]MCC9041418.1 MoaF N-terminal domain-containing protein [Myroides oncorhynchi]
MKTKILYASVSITLFLGACQSNNSKESISKETTNSTSASHTSTLIGHKAEIQFPEMKATITYTDAETLHWSTIGEDGVKNEGDEKLSYKQLSNNLHFLNWIEKDGFTVSQIINTKTGEVTAFWSYDGKDGNRESQYVTGSFTLID